MAHYTDGILNIFNNIQHQYNNVTCNYTGAAGDLSIGEYIILHLNVNRDANNILETRIINCRFSAMGSVMLIASAEYMCSLIEGLNIQEALHICDPNNKLGFFTFDIVPKREHAFNFVLQAFYKVIENINNYG